MLPTTSEQLRPWRRSAGTPCRIMVLGNVCGDRSGVMHVLTPERIVYGACVRASGPRLVSLTEPSRCWSSVARRERALA